MRLILAASLILCATVSVALSQNVDAAPRPFSVRDSIAFVRIGTIDNEEHIALPSPAGRRVAFVSHQGDLTKNVVMDTLFFFETGEVKTWLASGGDDRRRPAPAIAVRIPVASSAGHISDIRWVGDDALSFIAGDHHGTRQVYRYDLRTRKTSQLTHWATDLTTYAIEGDDLVFYATSEAPQPASTPVGDRSWEEFVRSTAPAEKVVGLYVLSLKTGAVEPISGSSARLLEFNQRIWISPDAKFAVTLAPATNAPTYWSQYHVSNYDLFGYTADRVSSDPTSDALLYRTRYALIDLQNRSIRPLLDAPSGMLSGNNTPAEVFWSADGRSVIVSNTYTPLDPTATDLDKRRSGPAIVEADLATGKVFPVMWEPTPDHASGAISRIVSLRWEDKQTLVVVGVDADGKAASRALRRDGAEHWSEATVPPQTNSEHPVIELHQSLNERPTLYAKSSQCSCSKELFDPNPQAADLSFGHVEEFHWTDANGEQWKGGLVLPPNYVSGKRYPLVVQTHGFDVNEFLIDGAFGARSAMAAQALANAGFVVLQVQDMGKLWGTPSEGPKIADGFYAGIEALIAKGLVDRGHVGLISWSRTGDHALELLARHRGVVQAATFADAIQVGYLNFLLEAGDNDSLAQLSAMVGKPDLASLSSWMAKNPLYALPAAGAAVRIEAYGPASVISCWEQYQVLRTHGAPVDFIYFPRGDHNLDSPAEQYASEQGNVDWFRFWLQDRRQADSPEELAEQHRWGGLLAGAHSNSK